MSGDGERGTRCSESLRGNECSNGEFQKEGFRNTPAHARGRSPDPLAVGQPFRHRAPGLRSRQPHHGTCRSLVKKMIANLYRKSRVPAVSFQGHVASASVFGRGLAFEQFPGTVCPAAHKDAPGRAGSGNRQLFCRCQSRHVVGCRGCREVSTRSGIRLNRRSGERRKHEVFQACDQHGPGRKPELAVPSMHSALCATPTVSLVTFGNPFLDSLNRLSGNLASR